LDFLDKCRNKYYYLPVVLNSTKMGWKMEDEILTVEELCKWLKITRKTSERWRQKGMPFIKVDKAVRFSKNDVERWLKEKQQK
jgi:excisionase family DNA binding protein